MRKICIVTGARSEYGLLRWAMEGIQKSSLLQIQIIATGMHLSPEFGRTIDVIEEDGFYVNHRVEMLLSSDSVVGVTKSFGLAVIGFADALSELKPDLLLVLGDRYEILAASTAATLARIPIAHIHGGELTEGLIDEAIRHSITKMSHLHFVATDVYRKRVIQLGEDPNRVIVTGGLGIDNILRLQLLSRTELEVALEFKLRRRNLLVTFHPVTLEPENSGDQLDKLLTVLGSLKDTGLIFTMPNAEAESHILIKKIVSFCDFHSNAKFYKSLGQLKYLSCIKYFDGVVGNSSSGLLEVPSFKKGTVNIGDRQKGRLSASSVIHCSPKREEIEDAIARLFSEDFKSSLSSTINPYGTGGSSDVIVEVLETCILDNILKKRFFDLSVI
jgi:GDP/UDP-N,N'-diacetylbacillosamine 2-epimerase (hydrolysing)